MQPEQQWYVGINGQQEGPLPTGAVVARVQQGAIPDTAYVFAQGMPSWAPIRSVPPFATFYGTNLPAPPPPPTGPRPADEIDYVIHGEELQCVEITLDPGEACIAEAGAMLYMEPDIKLDTIFGDGSQCPEETVGDKALSIGKRVLMGETIALTMFSNEHATDQRHVSFASPYPGKIVPLDLKQLGGKIICEKGAFLAAARGTKVDIEFQRKIATGLFGGEGFILQSLQGDGLAFVHAGGYIFQRDLKDGETLRVDTGCIVAFQPHVNYDVQLVGGIVNTVFGGEGLFLATLTGPGTVWLQTLPFSRLAGRIYAAAPQTGGRRIGEGSVLGTVGDVAMGNMTPQMPSMDANSLISGISRLVRGGGGGGGGGGG